MLNEIPRAYTKEAGFLRNARRAVMAVVVTELRIKIRNPASAVLIVFILALCQFLLVPASGASYTIISVNGLRPLLSTDTSVVAVGTVFCAMIFPVYVLFLGSGHARDRHLGIDLIHRPTPLHQVLLTVGRLVASLILVSFSSLIALALLVLTLILHGPSFPRMASLLGFGLAVLPVAFLAVPISYAIDRYLTTDLSKSIAAFFVWTATLLASVRGFFDVFGIAFIADSVLPGQKPADLSFGILSAKNLSSVHWDSVSFSPPYAISRLLLACGGFTLCILVCLAERYAPKGISPVGIQASARRADGSSVPSLAVQNLRRAPVSSVTPIAAAILLVRRWSKERKWFWPIVLISAFLSITSPFRYAVITTLVIPLAITRSEAKPALAAIGRTNPHLWHPTPTSFSELVLAGIMAIVALPAFVKIPALQVLHVTLGFLVSSAWLTWTGTILGRPLFGTSVYSLIWYMTACNSVPSQYDLFAASGTSRVSLSATAVLAAMLFLATVRADRLRLRFHARKRAKIAHGASV